MTQIGSAFVPVSDPAAAAEWYASAFGLKVASSEAHAAVLETGEPVRRLTLLGPASGIAAKPGLAWATCNLIVDDLETTLKLLKDGGSEVSGVNGDEQSCLWFTATDLDGNKLLICDR
ncbi:VOC family protein [Glycomyces tarimensis]